jgi:hypothetical protein
VGCSAAHRQRSDSAGKGRKAFFFEKKKQKTFTNSASTSRDRLSPNEQKFFASFFQKRRPSFLPPDIKRLQQRSLQG